MDSIFCINTNIYYEDDGKETRTVMGRDIIVLKDGGRIQESYRYTDTPQPHVGIVKEPAKSVLTFDKKGRLTEIFSYFTNGQPWTKEVSTYAASGLTGEAKGSYIPDDKPSNSSYCKLFLDKRANIIKKEIATGRIDSPLVLKYVYDGKDQIIQEEWHSIGSPITTIYNRKYDNRENLIEESVTSIIKGRQDETRTTTYTYDKFDSHNNWLLRNAYIKDKLRGRIERRITYHK